jgi:hypothetical protein
LNLQLKAQEIFDEVLPVVQALRPCVLKGNFTVPDLNGFPRMRVTSLPRLRLALAGAILHIERVLVIGIDARSRRDAPGNIWCRRPQGNDRRGWLRVGRWLT